MFKKRVKKAQEKKERKYLKSEFFLIFVLIFSFSLFFHFKETRFFLFELNHAAPKDIVAIEDFSYLNKKQMILLRQEAMVDIGKIWKIKESYLEDIEKKILRTLSNHPSWRNSYSATYREMRHITNVIKDKMESWHFTDRRTYRKREEINISVDKYSILDSQASKKPSSLPNNFWGKLQGEVLLKNKAFDKEVKFLIGMYANYKYQLIRDHDERIKMENSLYETIPEVFSHKSKNDLIVKRGDKISSEEYEQILAMKAAIQKSKNLTSPFKIIASILLAMFVLCIGWLYVHIKHKHVLKEINSLWLITVLIVVTLIASKLAEWVISALPHTISTYVQFPVIIPFMSIMLALFVSDAIALFATMYLTVIIGLTISLDQGHFIIINILSGIVAALYASKMKKRKEIFSVCFKVWGICAITLMLYLLSIGSLFSMATLIDLSAFAVNIMAIATILVVLIPITETIFGIMTNMALMEYIDPTHPLLQRLSLEAPGTYQHSLSIGHIAEYAANAIGANGMLCRVTALYHDIGKLNNPHYYIENQLVTGQKPFNIHQLLTPIESAYIIKSHVLDGRSLVKQYNLPKIFTDIILEHHGTTLIKFFYVKQLKEMNDVKEDVDEKAFRYPGPKPSTKESAIIMMADSIEAASRTLDENSEEAVRKLVEEIVSSKVLDGQFDNCNLSFSELAVVKQKLVEIIKATHHLRIKYPEIPKE